MKQQEEILGAEIAESPEEKRRRETRERVQKFRLKEKLARTHPDAWEYGETMMPVKWTEELAKYTNELSETILKELPTLADGKKLREPEAEIIELLAHVILGLDRKYQQPVRNPVGIVFGSYFGDAAAATVIEFVHRNAGSLPHSETFANLYKQMVEGVAKYFKNATEPDDCLLDVRAELAGNYKLRVERPVETKENTKEQ